MTGENEGGEHVFSVLCTGSQHLTLPDGRGLQSVVEELGVSWLQSYRMLTMYYVTYLTTLAPQMNVSCCVFLLQEG